MLVKISSEKKTRPSYSSSTSKAFGDMHKCAQEAWDDCAWDNQLVNSSDPPGNMYGNPF